MNSRGWGRGGHIEEGAFWRDVGGGGGGGGGGREVTKKSLRANQRNTCVQYFREKLIELFKYKHTMD